MLQAKAKALSATEKMNPPCALPWPFSMKSVTSIDSVASPGATWSIRMPSRCEAQSVAHIASAQASASSCGERVVTVRHRPANSGLRFSRKAMTPSA